MSDEMLVASVIHEGDVFKNYRALCAALGIVPKAGCSRVAQQKEIATQYRIEKGKGNSLVVAEVHHDRKDIPRGKVGRPVSDFMLDLERLVAMQLYLLKDDGYSFAGQASTLLSFLGMCIDPVCIPKHLRSSKAASKLRKSFIDISDPRMRYAMHRMDNKGLIVCERRYYASSIDADGDTVRYTPVESDIDERLKQIQEEALQIVGAFTIYNACHTGRMNDFYNTFDMMSYDLLEGKRARLFDVVQATPSLFLKYGLSDDIPYDRIVGEVDDLKEKVRAGCAHLYINSESASCLRNGDKDERELYKVVESIAEGMFLTETKAVF